MILELAAGYALGKTGRTIVMADGKKKFDTYEDFVEHVSLLLAHNTYSASVSLNVIVDVVKAVTETAREKDASTDPFAIAVSVTGDSNHDIRGSTFSDPRLWGIIGLSDHEIQYIYERVNNALLEGCENKKEYLDWWKQHNADILQRSEQNAQGCASALGWMIVCVPISYAATKVLQFNHLVPTTKDSDGDTFWISTVIYVVILLMSAVISSAQSPKKA